MILSANGSPASPELQRRVQAIDPGLSVVWIPTFNSWAVFFRWPQSDGRWSEVRDGRMSGEDAHDLVCQLPADCPLDQAVPFIEHRLIDWGKLGRSDIMKLISKKDEVNAKIEQDNMAPVMEYAEELIDANTGPDRARHRVFMSEPVAQKPGKKRLKARETE